MAKDTLLRLPEVMKKVGLKKSTIYQMIKDQLFPAPIRLTPRSVAWLESEIDHWIAQRISYSRGRTSC